LSLFRLFKKRKRNMENLNLKERERKEETRKAKGNIEAPKRSTDLV